MTSFSGHGDRILRHGPEVPWTEIGRWTDITDIKGVLHALRALGRSSGGRAFDVVVAVDTDPGMAVWRDTATEFTGLLRRSRAFRRVDRCGLRMPPSGHDPLPPATARDPQPRDPGPAARLVLVLTDGTAPAWRSGALGRFLDHWGRTCALAIVHLLPFHAWPDAGIPTWPMSLQAARPGTSNRRLEIGPRGLGLDPSSALPGYDGELIVPVLELTPRSLTSWVRLITGGPSARVRLPLTYAALPGRPAPPAPVRLDASDTVARLRATVSSDVFALAVLLAAAPLAVPLIRRVMSRLRPGARISDFTQLRTHHVIHPVTGLRSAVDRPQVAYDFEPGIRGELLAAGRTEDLRQVVDVVTEAVGPAARDLWRFPELFADREVPSGPRNEETRLWLEAETAVLHALSGPYANRARTLEEEAEEYAPPPTSHSSLVRPTGAAIHHARRRDQEDPLNQPRNAPEPQTDPAHTAPGRLPGPVAHPMAGPSNRRTPAVWGNVPPRNPNFTGRGELLDALHRRLSKEKTTAVLPNALHGMGGVGKSQLAVEYLYRHLAEYDVIWWISAERTTQIALSLVELAQRLGLEASTEATWSVSEVLEALRCGMPYANWLLVFDNADSPEAVRPYFPSGGPGNILITSRNPQWASAAQPLEVDVFRREESVQLLRVRGPEISDEEADRLARALGDLPLAIEQAAAWRAETGMPANEYLRLLDEKMVDLLGLVAPLDYQLPVIAAWNVSLDQLETKNPAAMQLLQVCAFCAPEPISRTLFAGRPAHPIAPELDAVLHDPIRLGQAIREIGRYSLARFDHRTNSIQMHRLVQAALISRMTEAEQRRMRQGTHLLLAANDPTDPHNVINWPRYGELHAHLIVSEAVGSTDRWVRALIVNEVRYLCRWGNYDAALQLARSAYETWRRESGEDDAQMLEVSRWLGVVLFNMGSYEEAAGVNDRVLEAYRRTIGEDREDTLDALGNVAIDRRVKGDFMAALELSESVHQRYLRVLGPDDPETLRAAHNVAVSLRLTGDFARAKTLDEETLHSKTQIFGQDHVVTLVTWLGLILDIRELGDYLTALSFQLELTEQSTRLLGHDNPFTLSNHRHLAVALRKAGRHDEAREAAERSRSDQVRRYGENNPGAMQSMLELTIDLRHAGELEQARDLGRRSHSQYTASYGALHPHTLSAEVDLAITLRQLGAVDEARSIDERALTELRRALGERHPSVLITATNLASDLDALGEHEAARQLDSETLALSTEVLGPEHPSTLACAANLPLDLKALGRTEEAELLHATTAERLTRVLGADHPAVRQAVDWEHRADCDIDPLPL